MIPKDIKNICELFDCGVKQDISEPPRFKCKDGNIPSKMVTVYAIGEHPEYSAGLSGFTLTPYFYSMKALERYCRSKKGREAINTRAKETFPDDWLSDYQEWFDNICDGCFDIRGINASEHHCYSWSPFGSKCSDYYTHKGENIKGECMCPECNPNKRSK